MIEHFHCWCPLHIRYCDLDTLAHVNNSVYFVYFEEARSYYFHQLPRPEEKWSAEEEQEHPEPETSTNPRINPRGHHYGTLIKEVTCTYELPLVRSDKAEIGVRVVKVGRTSIVMEHVICDADTHERIFATGRSILVWCNYYTGRPHPVPSALRAAFEHIEGQAFPIP